MQPAALERILNPPDRVRVLRSEQSAPLLVQRAGQPACRGEVSPGQGRHGGFQDKKDEDGDGDILASLVGVFRRQWKDGLAPELGGAFDAEACNGWEAHHEGGEDGGDREGVVADCVEGEAGEWVLATILVAL